MTRRLWTAVADRHLLSGTVAALICVFATRRVAVHSRIRPGSAPHRPDPVRRTRGALRKRRHIDIAAWQVVPLAAAAVFSPALGAAVGLVLVAHVVGEPRRIERARRRTWAGAVPDLVELVRLAVGSGCTTHLTFLLIARHAGGPVGGMLERTASALREGATVSEALTELQDRVGPPIRPLCSALLGSERYGLPVTATLEALAVEARLARQRDAETRSRRLPVLLIFPLVLCILPAFALLTVVPLLGGGLSTLSW